MSRLLKNMFDMRRVMKSGSLIGTGTKVMTPTKMMVITRSGMKSAAVSMKVRKEENEWSGEMLLKKNLAIELRENCECEECILQSKATRQRKGTMRISEDVEVIEAKDEGDRIRMKWSDGHEGWINKNAEHHYQQQQQQQQQQLERDEEGHGLDEGPMGEQMFWNGKEIKEVEDEISFDFNELMKSEKEIQVMIEKLSKYGLVKVRKSFGAIGAAKILGKRIGLIRSTIYGDTFVVTSIRELLSTESQAFTNNELPCHTDLPYYKSSPDIFIFHCIENSKIGGDSYYVDGFNVASEFKRLHPDFFRTLSSIQVPFRKNFTDKGFDLISNHCIIQFDPVSQSLVRIHFDEGNRQSLNWDLSLDQKREFYIAFQAFRDMVTSSSFRYQFHMDPGDITIFDNRRVLHARTAFAGTRIMEGCYLDWPSIHAVYRSLASKT